MHQFTNFCFRRTQQFHWYFQVHWKTYFHYSHTIKANPFLTGALFFPSVFIPGFTDCLVWDLSISLVCSLAISFVEILHFIFLGNCWSDEGLPGGAVVKNSPASARDVGSISGWGRSPGVGNGNPLQYSSLENPVDRGVCWAIVHGDAKSWTWLSDWAHTHTHTHTHTLIWLWLLISCTDYNLYVTQYKYTLR